MDTDRQQYSEIYRELSANTMIVVFFKKDGTLRTMMCTRNMITAQLLMPEVNQTILNGRDKRCNINNLAVAVIDLIKGEPRQFSSNRVVYKFNCGEITTLEDLNKAYANYKKIEETYGKLSV